MIHTKLSAAVNSELRWKDGVCCCACDCAVLNLQYITPGIFPFIFKRVQYVYEIYKVIENSKKKQFPFDLSASITKHVHITVCGNDP